MIKCLSFCLILSSGFFAACRTTRPVVEVMDADAPKTGVPEEFLHKGATVETTFILTGISTPRQDKIHDRLDIRLQARDLSTEIFQKDYKIGDSLSIKPYTDYDVVITGFRNNGEIYSSHTCSVPLRMRSDLGANRMTAPLCSPAISN